MVCWHRSVEITRRLERENLIDRVQKCAKYESFLDDAWICWRRGLVVLKAESRRLRGRATDAGRQAQQKAGVQ